MALRLCAGQHYCVHQILEAQFLDTLDWRTVALGAPTPARNPERSTKTKKVQNFWVVVVGVTGVEGGGGQPGNIRGQNKITASG